MPLLHIRRVCSLRVFNRKRIERDYGHITVDEIFPRHILHLLRGDRADTIDVLVNQAPTKTHGFERPNQHGLAKYRIAAINLTRDDLGLDPLELLRRNRLALDAFDSSRLCPCPGMPLMLNVPGKRLAAL